MYKSLGSSLHCKLCMYVSRLTVEDSWFKTHGSESRGQEEAACATTTVSYLHGWQL